MKLSNYWGTKKMPIIRQKYLNPTNQSPDYLIHVQPKKPGTQPLASGHVHYSLKIFWIHTNTTTTNTNDNNNNSNKPTHRMIIQLISNNHNNRVITCTNKHDNPPVTRLPALDPQDGWSCTGLVTWQKATTVIGRDHQALDLVIS